MPVDKKGFGVCEVMALIVLALLLRMIASPLLEKADPSRPRIESKIAAELGREADLGHRQLAIFSGSIADSPAFGHSPFVNARSLQAGMEVKPLISSESVHISGIMLDHPSVTPVKSKSGEWNFPGLIRRPLPPGSPDQKAGNRGVGIHGDGVRPCRHDRLPGHLNL